MTTPFFVIEPTLTTDANFVSSNVPENDHPVWSSATAYTAGQRVIVTTGHHKIYEALTANTNKFPPDNPTDWLEVGPTNRWAAFDTATGTFTRQANSIQFVVSGSRHQGFAMLELEATHVRLEIIVGGVTKFDTGLVKTQDRSVVASWYDYLFADIDLQDAFILDEIPVYNAAQYRVTVNNIGGIAQIGNFILGQRTRFGFTEYNATLGIIDSSRKETDDFGRTTIVQRRFRNRMNVTVSMVPSVTDGVARKLAQLRARPALYVGAKDNYEMLNVYGFPRDWSVDIAFPTLTTASLEIEGI